jgi:hypothetical protein
MSVSYTLRMPDDLKRLLNLEAINRDESVANLVIAACWASLEQPNSNGGAHLNQQGVGLATASTKPDIAALRSICAGQVGREAEVAEIVSVDSAPQLQLCPHKEWAEDGEQYRCALAAGHKGKCNPGERI